MSRVSALVLLASCVVPSVLAWNNDNHTCAVLPRLYSCELSNATLKTYDTCCTPLEGLVLNTQFWDTYTGLESTGSVLPKNSWTIHGLWPDRCDGTYGQYCDLSRQYDPRPSPNTTTGLPNGTVVPAWKGGDIVTPLLKKVRKYDLLAYIQKYWKSQIFPDYDLIQHEFSKHATCFSTFDVGANNSPNCYSAQYVNATEASLVDYIESVVRGFVQYPTYQWLDSAGIKPSNSSGYNITTMQDVLTKASGAVPYLGCAGPTRQVLSEVWYYSHVLGRPQDGIFKPLNQIGKTNCNTTAPVWYYTRSNGSEV